MGSLLLATLLSCSDSGVKVYNTAPSAAITNPPDGSAQDEGTVLTFDGLVEDSQDDPPALLVTLASDKDGTLASDLVADDLGAVTYSTANLSPGNHAITLTAIDTQGEHDDDVIGITINDLADEPTIAVASPVPGQFGKEGQEWDFRALVSDAQDTPDQIEVTITSDQSEGTFCDVFADITGVAECTAALTGGTHFLTFTATDSDALQSSATIYFDVLGVEDQDRDHDGWTVTKGDCDDDDPSVHPGATEYANDVDDDCDGATDEGTSEYDDDGDGQTEAEGDCDDADADTWRGAIEVCDDIDNDCDLTIDEGTSCYDDDADGYTEAEGDCNDAATDVHPGGTETADGVDEDCDGYIDEGTSAFDDDGDCACELAPCVGTIAVACAAIVGGDCNDAVVAVSPSAIETCDAIDNDCDGTTDEDDATDASTWYLDGDSDSYGNPLSTATACSAPANYVANGDDCDDGDDEISPARTEVCDSKDNDCDGGIDEALLTVFYEDADADGYGDATVTVAACSKPRGYSFVDTDCDDAEGTTYPGAGESCDGADNDCDATIDEPDAVDADSWYQDDDGDGYGDVGTTAIACSAPSGYVGVDGDCDDLDPLLHPGVDEICDMLDNDCDGDTDEDDAVDARSWYADDDVDGYGAGSVAATACYSPSAMVDNDTDCDDTDPDINPGAVEACNLLDDNCDGTNDDGATVTYYRDADADGYGIPTSTTTGCSPPAGYVSNDDDCNDLSALRNPDTLWWIDSDHDNYGSASYSLRQCTQPTGFADDDDDCDDGDSGSHPGATESCNGDDDDCDGATDEANASGCDRWYFDDDNDGYGTTSYQCLCAASGDYRADNNDDCYDLNSAAKPSATSTWHTTNRGDGSYDWDCDAVATKQYTANYDCTVDWDGFSCDTHTDGWSTSSDPACGSSGTWDTGCSAAWFACDYSSSSSRTQGCR
jgi:hypothetical protein